MRNVLLTATVLVFLTAAPAWAQQEGTGATGGAPGATAGSGTQGGPAPNPAEPGGGTTAGQGTAAQAAKEGTGATGGAPGTAAAPGSEGGCRPGQSPAPGQAASPAC